jgi:ABC-type nitrate/sulfonate/bicarbonate transport system substrate-binding protein
MVAYMIRQAGGDLTADDIEPVDRGFYHTDALVDGDADIAFLAFYNFEIIESRHRDFEADLWELADYGVPDFNQLVLTAADEKVDDNPDEVQRFIDATQRGVEDTVEEGETAVELFFDRYPELRDENPELMDKTAAATREFFTPDLSQDIEMYENLVTFCEELDLSDGPVDVDAFIDEQFVE